jgi:hypothetical protein
MDTVVQRAAVTIRAVGDEASLLASGGVLKLPLLLTPGAEAAVDRLCGSERGVASIREAHSALLGVLAEQEQAEAVNALMARVEEHIELRTRAAFALGAAAAAHILNGPIHAEE